MKIYDTGEIQINGLPTGLHVTNAGMNTVVYSLEPYTEYKLPHLRYSLVHESPSSHVPGKEEFKKDILAILRSLA